MALFTKQLHLLAVVVSLLAANATAFTARLPQQSTRFSPKPSCQSRLGATRARNGIVFDDVTLGQGRRILPGDTVFCYYVGSFKSEAPKKSAGGFLDGLLGGDSASSSQDEDTIFDSVTEGEPFSFVTGKGQVIRGLDMTILGFDDEISPMNVGGKRKVTIPSVLAYGDVANGPIPANQDLTFELEVLDAYKVSDVTLQFRLIGYAAALGIPAIILFIGFNLLSGNWKF